MTEQTTASAWTGIAGIGVDLVENRRMREVLQRKGDAFKHRVFRDEEQAYCDRQPEPWRHYAGRFAVKEAVSKAFGTGIGEHIGWLDIEVGRNRASGAPHVTLHGKARELASALGVARVLVSLSHTHEFTVAQALLCADGGATEGAGER